MAQPQLHAINFKGKLIVIKKISTDEPRHEFLKRAWWIASNLHKYETRKEVDNLSYVWISHTMYNASYDANVLDKLKK